MIKVKRRDGESGERLLKRYSGHTKSRKMLQRARASRYFKQKARKRVVRGAAIMREFHRANNKKKDFLTG